MSSDSWPLRLIPSSSILDVFTRVLTHVQSQVSTIASRGATAGDSSLDHARDQHIKGHFDAGDRLHESNSTASRFDQDAFHHTRAQPEDISKDSDSSSDCESDNISRSSAANSSVSPQPFTTMRNAKTESPIALSLCRSRSNSSDWLSQSGAYDADDEWLAGSEEARETASSQSTHGVTSFGSDDAQTDSSSEARSANGGDDFHSESEVKSSEVPSTPGFGFANEEDNANDRASFESHTATYSYGHSHRHRLYPFEDLQSNHSAVSPSKGVSHRRSSSRKPLGSQPSKQSAVDSHDLLSNTDGGRAPVSHRRAGRQCHHSDKENCGGFNSNDCADEERWGFSQRELVVRGADTPEEWHHVKDETRATAPSPSRSFRAPHFPNTGHDSAKFAGGDLSLACYDFRVDSGGDTQMTSLDAPLSRITLIGRSKTDDGHRSQRGISDASHCVSAKDPLNRDSEWWRDDPMRSAKAFVGDCSQPDDHSEVSRNVDTPLLGDLSSRQKQPCRKLPNQTPGDAWQGQYVEIIAGKHKGKFGHVTEKIRKDTHKVLLENGTSVPVRTTSIQAHKVSDIAAFPEDAVLVHEEERQRSRVLLPSSMSRKLVADQREDYVMFEEIRGVAPTEDSLVGADVLITAGKNKGKPGRAICLEKKNTVKVCLGDNEEVRVLISSVEIVREATPASREEAISQQKSPPTARKSSRPRGTVSAASIRSKPMLSDSFCERDEKVGEEFKVPNHRAGGRKFGTWAVKRLRLSHECEKNEITLLSTLLGSRVVICDAPLNGRTNQKPFDRFVETDDGSTYELVSAKLYDDPDSTSQYTKPKVVRLMYAQTHGPGLQPFSLTDYLLRIADFSTLGPRKAIARLELLQSPAKLDVCFGVSPSEIKLLPDDGVGQGCGFLSDAMMDTICQRAGVAKSREKLREVVALQVRVLVPSMGLFKGMLFRKRISHGPQLLLHGSMLKVPASSHENPIKGVAILINRNGVFPSNGSANHYIGRRLDDELDAPPEKSFKAKIVKKLSPMVMRLWKSMGVAEKVCWNYAKRSTETSDRNHAWLVGVADPTGKLPPDTVYIPGMKNTRPNAVFVTRPPCVHHSDGRVLRTVTNKPDAMASDEWQWLEQLKFAAIVFSNPRPGKMSMPERIASGDLDGDLYLVCWDAAIVGAMTDAAEMPNLDMKDGSLKVRESDREWLTKAQDLMVDAGHHNDVGRLTGQLYKAGEKSADTKGLKHRDTAAFFNAYKNALEFRKHGNGIELPAHLHELISENLRHFLAIPHGRHGAHNV